MEGFGLPPLEAMAFGCPAIVLDNSSLAEVFLGWKGLAAGNSSDECILKLANELVNCKSARFESIRFSNRYSWDVTLALVISAYSFALSRK